ncbi:hypothetical protein [Coxiella endosymbiont of Ornithodoros amblus]|uniref:hypothetical protein n=1 Tax=Coxiella endosymbiont of Ornithodoros amblus TaxID=1656166 RepID=UPI00244DD907|nr:hypothetical protein [Coxiella endosymbiont of Ornithodoros amblus]
MSYSKFKLAQRVSNGEILSTIDPFGADKSATITNLKECVIVDKNIYPCFMMEKPYFQLLSSKNGKSGDSS